jgi:hypothetical protein
MRRTSSLNARLPPYPLCYDGLDAVARLMRWEFGPLSMGDWRLVLARANRQPAAASYLRAPGESVDSHARNPGPPSKLSRLRQVRRKVSCEVLGLLERTDHPAAVHVQLAAMALVR